MAKLPVNDFLTKRLLEYDPTFEVRDGTGFKDLFFKPVAFIVQPLRDEADNMQISQSFRRILLTADPDAYSEEAVDALANNLFVYRDQGMQSAGSARVFYNNPVDREWPSNGAVFTGSNGALYSNPLPYAVTAVQMGTQIQSGLFFYDIPVVSNLAGSFDLNPGGLVSLASDSEVVSVTNPQSIAGGLLKETNSQLIERAKNSISVRDLVVGKGFNAVLLSNFRSIISELQPIGNGDKEMMRDILFNVHVGSKVDGYVKTPTIKQGSFTVVGILIDTTRQAHTSANVAVFGTTPTYLGNPNIDRTGGLIPVVSQVKANKAAYFLSTVDLTNPVDLSATPYIRIGVDGVFKDVHVVGASAVATTRAEVISLVNAAFSLPVLSASGVGIAVRSPTSGVNSQIVIAPPTVGVSASQILFGLSVSGTFVYQGDGPINFAETRDYVLVDVDGTISRVVGPTILGTQTSGQITASSAVLTDATAGVFLNVGAGDILTVESGPDAGDYRILSKTNTNTLVLDVTFLAAATVTYHVTRTGIKDKERIYVDFYYNPLSIDVGPLVKLDPLGASRGVRPGRDALTIKDVAFLRVTSIEIIDPLTLEGLGTFLKGTGGFGVGGFGAGGFGVGSGAEYRLVVNSPTERFSAFEDAFINLSSAYQGYSLKVNYDYVPEIVTLHNFVRSESERVLDGDILMKHFLPAYVSGEIQYTIDKTDSSIPDNATLTDLVSQFISLRKAGTRLIFSTIEQFLTRVTDPFDRFGTRVNSFSLSAKIHNADGTLTVVSGVNALDVPTLIPFPKFTTRPLSPRIVHWIADNIVLTRLS